MFSNVWLSMVVNDEPHQQIERIDHDTIEHYVSVHSVVSYHCIPFANQVEDIDRREEDLFHVENRTNRLILGEYDSHQTIEKYLFASIFPLVFSKKVSVRIPADGFPRSVSVELVYHLSLVSVVLVESFRWLEVVLSLSVAQVFHR